MSAENFKLKAQKYLNFTTRSALSASGFPPTENGESWCPSYCVLVVCQNKAKWRSKQKSKTNFVYYLNSKYSRVPLIGYEGRFPLRPIRPCDQATSSQGMRSSKSKLKASVCWQTHNQFWKLNQVQLFRDQNKRKPIRLLFFNARACNRTGSRNQIR